MLIDRHIVGLESQALDPCLDGAVQQHGRDVPVDDPFQVGNFVSRARGVTPVGRQHRRATGEQGGAVGAGESGQIAHVDQ
jgi:hypothetical protein